MKLNLPNKLTIIRIFLVPVFMILLIAVPDETLCRVLAAIVFILTALTDMLDGKIARKRGLITNFGKFMDPLADKFMVFGALLCILYRFDYIRPVFIWAAAIVMFRELAVTSIRLVASGQEGLVIAASWLGKVKTVTQVVCIRYCIAGAVVLPFTSFYPVAYSFLHHHRGHDSDDLVPAADYLRHYWKFITPNELKNIYCFLSQPLRQLR